MKITIVSLALWLLICSCGNNASETTKETPVEKSYFPISEYVKGEIRIVDSLPVGIMKKFKKGSRMDSSFIERPEFHTLAGAFANADLDESNLEANYKEHSFLDQSTGYFTFTYEPITPSASYHRIDVLVKPGANSDKVSSIYMEKSSVQQDTTINERYFWKANTSFTITREKKFKEQNPVVEQLIVIWDPLSY